MPITPHIEKHFLTSALVRDIVIGMAASKWRVRYAKDRLAGFDERIVKIQFDVRPRHRALQSW
jgi:hypothetical protein